MNILFNKTIFKLICFAFNVHKARKINQNNCIQFDYFPLYAIQSYKLIFPQELLLL